MHRGYYPNDPSLGSIGREFVTYALEISMSIIHVPTVLTRPEKEWETLLRQSEEDRDEELRSDDREYLVRMLVSEASQKCDPAGLLIPTPALRFALAPHPHEGVPFEKERQLREEVAGQMLISLGLFPDLLFNGTRTPQSLPVLAHASERAFAYLGNFIQDEKERRRSKRFSEHLFRYVDALLSLHEHVHQERLPRSILFFLAQAGSMFAKNVLLPPARRH